MSQEEKRNHLLEIALIHSIESGNEDAEREIISLINHEHREAVTVCHCETRCKECKCKTNL